MFSLIGLPVGLLGVVSGPLKVDSGRYFVDAAGNRVLLTGWHTWNLVQNVSGEQNINFTNYVTELKNAGANYIRFWQLDRRWWGSFPEAGTPSGGAGWVDIIPYARSSVCCSAGETANKWDLTKYNSAYFSRLSQYCQIAQNQGVYVSVMLFEACDSVGYGYPTSWDRSPYNKKNNINGVLTAWTNMYRLSGPTFIGSEAITISNIYKAYIRKVVDTVNGFDNVLYEVMNEGLPISSGFQYWVINEIHAYEATKPKRHPVGMTSFWGSPTDNNVLLSSPADWWSPHGTTRDGYGIYQTDPPIQTGTKAAILDTDHIWGVDWSYGNNYHYPVWAWKAALRGYNPIYMDTGPYGSWYNNTHDTNFLRNTELMGALCDVRYFVNRIGLNRASPSTTVASTRFCLANSADGKFLVLQPGSGSSFTVSVGAGVYDAEWYDLASGNVSSAKGLSLVQGANTFVPYYKSAPCVLFLQKTVSPAAKPTVTATASDSSAGEPSNGGAFTFTRSNGSGSLMAYFSVTGTAIAGADYAALGNSVAFADGQTVVNRSVSIINDSTAEATETLVLSLKNDTNYVIGSPSNGTINITSDDASGATGSIVSNGSFESDFTGWTVNGNCGIRPGTATDGTKVVVFNQNQTIPNGIIYQTLQTTPGKLYSLTFDQGVYAYNTREQRMLVTVRGNNALLSQYLSIFGGGNGTVKWAPRAFTFTADSSSVRLSFQDVSPTSEALDMWLDKVIVK